jgi:hypothetical protein
MNASIAVLANRNAQTQLSMKAALNGLSVEKVTAKVMRLLQALKDSFQAITFILSQINAPNALVSMMNRSARLFARLIVVSQIPIVLKIKKHFLREKKIWILWVDNFISSSIFKASKDAFFISQMAKIYDI